MRKSVCMNVQLDIYHNVIILKQKKTLRQQTSDHRNTIAEM